MAQKSLMSATVALPVVFLMGGCATQQPVAEQRTAPPFQQRSIVVDMAPPQPTAVALPVQQPASVAVSEVAPREVMEFPTSKRKPQGKPWATMHEEGFTGGYDVACTLLSLTAKECTLYKGMHSRGECVVVEVMDGVVLDRLTYTRNGVHQVDYLPKVALVNPSTRKTEVCDLGKGTFVMRFHGCNNHGIVRGFTPTVRTKVTPMAPVATKPQPTCEKQPMVRINVWDNAAMQIPCVREAIAAARAGAGYFNPKDLSRACGAILRKAHAEGKVGRHTAQHEVSISILSADGTESPLIDGLVTGQYDFPFPPSFSEGEVMRVVFHDLGKLHSPISNLRDLRASYAEYTTAPCGSITHLHAVGK